LEIDIIAEGVETADQLQYLTDRGVTLVQGFYFSKPITEADLLEAKFGESKG
jgi:sensor c-di-GMP phosphodiesterase-like protein